MSGTVSADQIADQLREARSRTLALVEDLTDEELMGPRLPIVNPLLWEIGHVAWFHDHFVLRQLYGLPPTLPDGDALYNSATVPHDARWDLPLPSRATTLGQMQAVLERLLDRLERDDLDPEKTHGFLLALFHEDMHDEAFTYVRQTLGYRPPRFRDAAAPDPIPAAGPLAGDAEVEGGSFVLGSTAAAPFAFDNELQAHPVQLRPFAIARAPVTEAEYLEFVEDGGYERPELWAGEGRRWRDAVAARGEARPLYWRREPGGEWLRRRFDRWTPLFPHLPVLHVNGYEAEAYCRWAGRRLPTEAEWEFAASGGADGAAKHAYPWGDDAPSPSHSNLDWREAGAAGGGLVDVGALPASDSPHGCRQMLGNVWEWTASAFAPYPGFSPGLYKEYSEPWFGTHRVLRGGSWATRGRLIRNAYRNYYTPERRDVMAGFRTCGRPAGGDGDP